MIYEIARQLIGMFFLVAVVNLLVIPEGYKKIITFYMHFFIIVIILTPLIRIMNNEAGSFAQSFTFISEAEFEQSVQQHGDRLEASLDDLTTVSVDEGLRQAARICAVSVQGFDLEGGRLAIQLADDSPDAQMCILRELGLSHNDVIFERGGY